MTGFDFIFDDIHVIYMYRKIIFRWNYDNDTSLGDTSPLKDTPLFDTTDDICNFW